MPSKSTVCPRVRCPDCLSQWVNPDPQTPGQWDCEECGWTGLEEELLSFDSDQPDDEED